MLAGALAPSIDPGVPGSGNTQCHKASYQEDKRERVGLGRASENRGNDHERGAPNRVARS
jgi:hypothetical protein